MKNLIIHSSLKDSYVLNGKFIAGLYDAAYEFPFKNFIQSLSRKSSQEILPYELSIISGSSGEATQLKAIIPVPPGWGGDRFMQVALKEWAKNPSADFMIAAYLSVK